MEIKEKLVEESGLKSTTKSQIQTTSSTEGGVKEITITTGEKLDLTSNTNEIIFVIRGQIECEMEGYPSHTIDIENMFFIRVGIECMIKAKVDSKLILIRSGSNAPQKDSFAQAYMNGVVANDVQVDLVKQPEKHIPILPFNAYIHHFTLGLLSGISYCIQNEFYTRMKIREFFFLIGISYSERDRFRFFEMLNTAEQSFAAFIYLNYKQVASVKELAALACYSLSGFEKRFRKIFGQSASQWIANKKAQMIYSEICDTTKPFKQLSHEYGFSYQAHFTRFCRKHLGQSPLLIRESHKIDTKSRNKINLMLPKGNFG